MWGLWHGQTTGGGCLWKYFQFGRLSFSITDVHIVKLGDDVLTSDSTFAELLMNQSAWQASPNAPDSFGLGHKRVIPNIGNTEYYDCGLGLSSLNQMQSPRITEDSQYLWQLETYHLNGIQITEILHKLIIPCNLPSAEVLGILVSKLSKLLVSKTNSYKSITYKARAINPPTIPTMTPTNPMPTPDKLTAPEWEGLCLKVSLIPAQVEKRLLYVERRSG